MKEHPLIIEAGNIAHKMYEIAEAIEAALPDEKWRTVNKLKQTANDAYFFVAQVVADGKGSSQEFECINARKSLKTLKSLYVFASKEHMTELDPSLIVHIEQLATEMNSWQKSSQQETVHKNAADLEPWLEKYRIWKQISKD